MGKPTPKNKYSTPTASSVPPKGVAKSSHGISKSTPRHPPKQTTIQMFREAAVALVSTQGSKSKLRLSVKSTSEQIPSNNTGVAGKSNSSRPPSMTFRKSRSRTNEESKRCGGNDQLETTFVVNKDSHEGKAGAGAERSQLRRSGTFTVRNSTKKNESSDPAPVSEKTTGEICDQVRKSNSVSGVRRSRSHASSMDKLIDPIMDCMTTLEKQHQECIKAMLRSCVINALLNRKTRQSPEALETQAKEVDSMIQELSDVYEMKIEKLLSMKRHTLKQFMYSQFRQRNVNLN